MFFKDGGKVMFFKDEDSEVAVTMKKRDWKVVHEFFTSVPYEEDWREDGLLEDNQLEGIREKLAEAIK